MGVEDFGRVDDEVVDPRPLRRLGLVSGSVLVAAVVVLVHQGRRGAGGLSGPGLLVVWLVAVLAGLLLLAAGTGLLGRRAAARRRTTDPQELHDRQVVLARLRRGDPLPPELADLTQRVVDDTYRGRLGLLPWFALSAFWAGSAFTYAGWERALHLVLGVGYLVAAGWRLRDQRHVVRAAARLGIRPQDRLRKAVARRMLPADARRPRPPRSG